MAFLRKVHIHFALQILVFACTCANVLSAAITQVDGVTRSTTSISDDGSRQGERVEFVYRTGVFQEIDPDIYQVVGHRDRVILNCISTKGKNVSIDWVYHGIKKHDLDLTYSQNSIWVKNYTSGPSVMRLECVDKDDGSITNNTFIYSGDGKPPFLFNNGKSVTVTGLNETTVILPCLLNYPLDNVTDVELQLFKDGVRLDNTSDNCLNYVPEQGYFLNISKLEQPLGNYECRVINSTNDDFLKMNLQQDDIIRALVDVKYYSIDIPFFEGDTIERNFICKVPTSKFEDKFSWFFLWRNGSYTPIYPEKSTNPNNPISDQIRFVDSVKFTFPSVNITHVVCAGFLKNSTTSYNNTHAVVIRAPVKPKIVHAPLDGPIIYKKGVNLTCASLGDPLTFTWFKDGDAAPVRLSTSNYFANDIRSSILHLDPTVDDVDSNYTCEVKNFLGTANFSYRVQLPENKPFDDEGTNIWPVVGICLAVMACILLLLFTFCKFERRQFPREKIERFFHGIVAGDVPYNEFDNQVSEAYESVSYDRSKEININSLSFVRELNRGNFGKVQHGIYRNTNEGSSIHVAIKSIKDNPTATEEEINDAFSSFLREIKLMQILGEHENVVKYIGAVTSDIRQYHAYLVVEYCCEGDLRTYLHTYEENGGSFYDDIQGLYDNRNRLCEIRGNKSGIVLKTSHLMKWSADIASGMEYVASKNLLHRDLAARNVLLSYEGGVGEHPCPENLTAKISDFGLSKDLHDVQKDYYQIVFHPQPEQNRQISLPLRWMSIEALEGLRFTTQNDVWAFAVTLWEMFSFGLRPYDDFKNGSELRGNLITQIRQNASPLLQPDFAPVEIWDIMQKCWNLNAEDRPNFQQLKMVLRAINDNLRNQEDDFANDQPVQQATSGGYSTVDFLQNSAYSDEFDEEEYDMQTMEGEETEEAQ